MTLRTRLALFVALAVGVAVAAVAVFAYNFAQDEAMAEVDRFLQERGPVVGLLSAIELDDYRIHSPAQGQRQGQGSGPAQGSGPGAANPMAAVVQEDVIAQLVDADGDAVALGETAIALPVTEEDLALAQASGPDLLRHVYVDDIHYRMLSRHLTPGIVIQVARDLTGTDSILSGLRLRLLLLGVGGVVVAAAVGWLISRRSLRPVADLTAAAAHVAETRDLDSRIDVARSDELGQLADSFNAMLGALEEARLSQQRLVADASHELRTPLTSLRTNIELLERGTVSGTDLDELLADVGHELIELTNIVGELVDLATIGRHEEPRIEVDLEEILEQAASQLRRRTDQELRVTSEPTPLEGRPQSLLRAVSNLLENAVKWGDGAPIEANLARGRLSVRDHGPGIPDDDLDRVFERFYRSPAARSMPGSGLGLSIVAAVVEDHGGRVFAENAPDGGAVVGFDIGSSTP
jgi:two-component system sensor histidine kinase MprB